jgi:hypothetical protein
MNPCLIMVNPVKEILQSLLLVHIHVIRTVHLQIDDIITVIRIYAGKQLMYRNPDLHRQTANVP